MTKAQTDGPPDDEESRAVVTARIDLNELARRENEQTEWKENVAEIDDVVATLSAFANDLQNLGGGYVVCGVREDKDEYGFPTLVRVGLTASRLKEDLSGRGSFGSARRAARPGWEPA